MSDTMRNKILVIESDLATRNELDRILQEIVEEGGELFFTDKKEDALALIAKEKPQVLLLDAAIMGKTPWKLPEEVHLIVTVLRGEKIDYTGDVLSKPFKSHQVLEKCRSFLTVEVSRPIPPM